MEIKIRNVDEQTASLVNKVAKKKSLSREEYLRQLLEKETALYSRSITLDDQSKVREHLAFQMKRNNYLLEETLEVLEELTDE
ncbi:MULTISPECIES: hypothetical protein [unclassified Lactococcus]|uniref:hypothetical protein n=1 Tax=unclassified Lactococcus TaxID=2643510 RepID=UPI0011C9FA28|nr:MULTISPECIES: hypothetical protein [unclassified Lactococcus]MQW24020.1 hypothetical protein [Lactococcus sp. dk101]TXK36611.1 hypothetical protein FVP42_11065 [Lactococcus sp. dk310]TXK46923.1 hypothetical protein FVP43_10670 [Lactococcus sp. dk322]